MIGSAVLSVAELPGEAIMNGATLPQGSVATTIKGQAISFGPSGLVALGTGTLVSSAFTTTIGAAALTLTELPGEAIVNGATLSSGGPDTTINGVVVTYGPSGLIARPTGTGTTAVFSLGGIIVSLFGQNEDGEQILYAGHGELMANLTGSTSDIAIDIQLLTQAGASGSATVVLPTK